MEQMPNNEAQAESKHPVMELMVAGIERVLESKKITRALSIGSGAVAAAEVVNVTAGSATINETIPGAAIALGTALAVEFGWLSHTATQE